MCQLIFIGKEGALCVQDILERSKSLFIEVERKLQCLLPLIDDFPERDNLFDRVLVGIHGIVHSLDARAFTRRSAARMSGRRSSRFAGMPMPIVSMYSGNGFRVSMISRTSQG